MKTEKEKMLAGEFYDGFDETLVKERLQAKALTYEYNHSRADETEKREKIIKQLLVTKGKFHIEADFNCDYGYNIKIGENFFANFGCTILDGNKVKIGDNVLFGPNVHLYTATHPTDPNERLAHNEYSKPISIGNTVWIGGSSVICPGVKIGNNVTIGAGSVVTKDIPDNVVAVGNPCKIIKKI